LTPGDGRWSAVGEWVVEHCAEQPEEPAPLFRVQPEANAATVARIHNDLLDEVARLTAENVRLRSATTALLAQRHVTPEWADGIEYACLKMRAALTTTP
jgi:hypothetical protein